jgi:DNA-binding GntR family transcriptional regulator
MVRTGLAGRRYAEARLRAAIARGDVAPGQRLIEEELANRFAVTRSSLRQAIDALLADGLVERVRNRGARVRRLSLAEAVEITECRMALEGLLARKAAERATDADVVGLGEQIEAMRGAVEDGDVVLYSALIDHLYELVHQAARHTNATALVTRLQAQLVRHQFQLSLRPGRPRQSLRELSLVVEAISAHRPGTAERLAKVHLQGVVAALVAQPPDQAPDHQPHDQAPDQAHDQALEAHTARTGPEQAERARHG